MKQQSKPGLLICLTAAIILSGCTLISTIDRSSISPTAAPVETNDPLPTPQTSIQTMTPTTAPSATPEIEPTQPPAADAQTLEDAQGAVVVNVTPLNLNQPANTIDFEVSMNTHSVDLSMDLTALATLSTDTGISVTPVIWDAPMGGHHVSGKLSFPANADGSQLMDGAQALTLTIRDVDAPERTFTWDLNIN